MEPTLARIEVAQVEPGELFAAEAAAEERPDEGCVTTTILAVGCALDEEPHLAVGEGPADLVLHPWHAHDPEGRLAVLVVEPPFREESREGAQRHPGAARRLGRGGRPACGEIRLDGASFDIADLRRSPEGLRCPRVKGADREAVIGRGGLREVVAVDKEAIDHLEKRGVLVTHVCPSHRPR